MTAADNKFIDVQRDGKVMILTMSHPEKHNVLKDQWQFDEIEALCRDINNNLSVNAVILTATGKSFCAGGDVKDMANQEGMFEGPPYALRNNYRTGIQKIPLALYNLEVPTIAAVNGNAIGAGCDLACMCDIRIGSEHARFAESFVKVGIVPGDGGAWFLPRIVGLSKAYEMSFTGDSIQAEEALDCGLISRLVPHDQLLPAALELAGRMASNSGPALRMTKKLLREGLHQRLDTLLELSASMQALSHNTQEHQDFISRYKRGSERPATSNHKST